MNKLRIVKYAAYGAEVFLALIIQGTPYLLPEVFGGKALLLMTAALTIAVFEEEIPSLVFAVICGFLADCSYSGPIGFYAILFSVMCYTLSYMYGNYIQRNLLTAMLAAVIAVPVMFFLQFLFYYIFAGYDDVWVFFARHYFSRIIYTLALVPPFYGLNKLLNKRMK